MTTVFRPLAVLVLLALVSACGQMGPLVIPDKTPANAPAPAADGSAMEAPAPEPQVVKPEPAPLPLP